MFAIRVNKAKFNCKTLIQTFIAFFIFFHTYNAIDWRRRSVT